MGELFKIENDKQVNVMQVSTLSILTGVMTYYLEPIIQEPIPITMPIFFIGVGASGLWWYYSTKSKYTELFKNLNLGTNKMCYPLKKSKQKSDFSTIYKFTLPSGLCLADFEKHWDAIQQFAGCEIDMRYTYKEFIIEEFHVKMKEKFNYSPEILNANIPILVGHDRRDNVVSFDLADGSEPHCLIGGETGCGKSNLSRCIITNLILTSNVVLHLVDLKNGTEFNVFQKSSKVANFCRTINEVAPLLDELLEEVDRRADLLYDNELLNIHEYNKKFKNKKLNFHLLIIDEFADLKKNKVCKDKLDELGRKARFVGVHMIFSTQRPDKDVIDGSIKANVTTVIGLKTKDGTNSGIIIGSTGLEKLRGKGHGILSRGERIEFQAPFLDTDTCRNLIKHTYIDKKKSTQNDYDINLSEVNLFND